MSLRLVIILASVALISCIVILALLGVDPLAISLFAVAAAAFVFGTIPAKKDSLLPATMRLVRNPRMLASQRRQLEEALAVLQMAQELQRSVFDVSAELVSCVDENDARQRFGSSLRTWWWCKNIDLFVWERGRWRSLGGDPTGDEPTITKPVVLPEEHPNGDLLLDLSPGVDGQAAVVLRQATPQPSLDGRSTSDQRYIADVLRGQLALSLRRVILFQELQRLGRTDPLTGCNRRWYGEERLHEMVEAGYVLAVAMVDIDKFKVINDEHGHTVGDDVLRAVGKTLGEAVRVNDVVCRFGGEEFLIIFDDTGNEGATMAAERVRFAIARCRTLPVPVTVSIGLACLRMDETAESLVARADEALYVAKSSGRDRVILAAGDEKDDGLVRTAARQNSGSTRWGRSGLFYKGDEPPTGSA